MAKIDAETIERWRDKAKEILKWLLDGNLRLEDISTGRDAWTVAHRAGIVQDAYAMSRDIHDAHIQTALEKIFPNAVFRDKKRY